MKSGFINRFVAVIFGLLLFLILAEAGSRVVFSQVMNFNVEMWKYARKVKVSGLTKDLRFEHRPGVKAVLMGVNISINSGGMRGPDVAQIPEEGTFRIAVIGDSIAMGWGVEEKEIFARKLEIKVSQLYMDHDMGNVEILNFGVGNYNIEDDYKILREKVLGYQPDVVLLSVFINDAEPGKLIKKNLLYKKSCFAVWLWGRLDSLCRKTGFRSDFREYYRNLYIPGGGGLKRMRESISRISSICRQNNITLISVILPELHQLKDYPFLDIHTVLESIFSNNGVPVLDLYPSVEDIAPEKLWVSRDDAHPNELAHAYYAEAIASGFNWDKMITGRLAR